MSTVLRTHSKSITDHPGHRFWGFSEKVPIGVPIGGPTRVTRVIRVIRATRVIRVAEICEITDRGSNHPGHPGHRFLRNFGWNRSGVANTVDLDKNIKY